MSKNVFVETTLREWTKHNAENNKEGRQAAAKKLAEMIRPMYTGKDGKVDVAFVQRVNWRNLFEKLVVEQDLEENLTSSAFPVIAGEMISAVMVDGYESFPKNGKMMVRTVPSKRKVSQIAGWTAIGRIASVNERESFPEINPPQEKWFAINNKKYGAKITLTKEDIFFDQTGELINRARQVGEEAARAEDEIILDGVTGRASDAFNPSGAAATLYSAGNNNLITTNSLGTAGWENTDVKLTQQVDDNTGKPIWVFGDRPVMIVPAALKHTAWKLRNNDRGELGSANLDRNPAQNAFEFIVDPYATDATTWYYGSPMRQFRWEEIWPVEVVTRVGADTKDGFDADIVQQFRVSFYGGVGAVDTRYVIKNTAA